MALSVFGSSTPLKLRSNFAPVSGVRIREEMLEAEGFGQKALLPGPLARTRQLLVTYLDDELLVVRDESGIADVLVRKEKFAGAQGEPDTYDDGDGSPAA